MDDFEVGYDLKRIRLALNIQLKRVASGFREKGFRMSEAYLSKLESGLGKWTEEKIKAYREIIGAD